MEGTNLKPNPKLFTKQIYIFLTITVLILIFALLLQLLIPLSPRTSFGQVSIIVWPIAFGLIFLLWLISVPIALLWIKNLEYFVENDRIRIHKGILSKIQQNIPYRAITDFILHRSLYDRFLGIASIRIQTAGQSASPTGYEGNIAGITEWDQKIEDLRGKVKAFHRQSAEGKDTKKDEVITSGDILKELMLEVKRIRQLIEDK